MIEGALERSAGNISETARLLGLTRRGLYLKMQRLGVERRRVCLVERLTDLSQDTRYPDPRSLEVATARTFVDPLQPAIS